MGDWLKILGPVGIISALAVYLNMNPEVVQQVVDFFPDLMDQIKAQAIRWGTKLIEEDAEEINLNERPFKIKTQSNLM